MSRQIQDQNLLVWEVYPTGGPQGFSTDPYVMFHCLTQRHLRPRRVSMSGDEADAERTLQQASDAELLALLQQSSELP